MNQQNTILLRNEIKKKKMTLNEKLIKVTTMYNEAMRRKGYYEKEYRQQQMEIVLLKRTLIHKSLFESYYHNMIAGVQKCVPNHQELFRKIEYIHMIRTTIQQTEDLKYIARLNDIIKTMPDQYKQNFSQYQNEDLQKLTDNSSQQ